MYINSKIRERIKCNRSAVCEWKDVDIKLSNSIDNMSECYSCTLKTNTQSVFIILWGISITTYYNSSDNFPMFKMFISLNYNNKRDTISANDVTGFDRARYEFSSIISLDKDMDMHIDACVYTMNDVHCTNTYFVATQFYYDWS